MEASDGKLGLQSTWSMAVGGMVGGGIFSTLGVVIGIAGRHAWLSFLVAGLVVLLAGYSYSRLAIRYGEGGGAFTFLREIHKDGFAGSLAWVLIVGYVLTNAVYAHTFGAYLDHLIPLGPQGARLSALAIVLPFLGVNLRGAGEAGNVEVFLVWFKLAVLFCLAGFGLARWNPAMLGQGVPDAGLGQAIFGAAAVFMAYEGFQLLTYDYEDIRDPDRTLPHAIFLAIPLVILVYVAVALGTPMLVGADVVVEHQEVSLALAGQEAFGTVGLILVSVAAAFATLGSLSSLVESASLAFLFTFAVVGGLAFAEKAGSRVLTGLGAFGAGLATIVLAVRLARTSPFALMAFAAMVLVATVGRPLILRRTRGR